MNVIGLFSFLPDTVFALLYFRRRTYAPNKQRPWLKFFLLLAPLPLYIFQDADFPFQLPFHSAILRTLVRAALYFTLLYFSEGVPFEVSAYGALFWTAVYSIFQNIFTGPYLSAFFVEQVPLLPSPLWNVVLLSSAALVSRVLYFGGLALIIPFPGIAGADTPNIVFAAAVCAVEVYTKVTGMDYVMEFAAAPTAFFVNYVLLHGILLLLLITYEYSRRHTLEATALQLQNTAAQALLENIQSRQQSEESIRSLRHDLKNHAITLQLLLEQGDAEEAMRYLDAFQAQAAAPAGTYHTGNELLDGLLRQKLSPALELGIPVRVTLDFREGGFIDPFDLCVLMGSALDNAVEACQKVEPPGGRFIEVSGGPSAGCLLIRVKNSCAAGGLVLNGGLPSTTKVNKALHGFGLRGIKRVLEHYDGSLTITTGEDHFISTMLIPISGRAS